MKQQLPLQPLKSAMERRRLTPAWIRGKVETLEAPAEAAQLPPRRKAATAAKWNGLSITTPHFNSKKLTRL
ncbi:hypothetical protein RGU11_04595 [Rossellomorea marisflavi]|jgi:hypothetical protein|uniref:hypothetical protein n=1 Tax=Rossellomorea marisflavi TaxID=189381 RepID=UPI002853600D|nr:hypothetical protein [Rossellomorea marisflavi]MDR4935661.1 hypothetical protein [Rossellomorea marisflavi]